MFEFNVCKLLKIILITFDNLIRIYYFNIYLQVTPTGSSTVISSMYNIPELNILSSSDVVTNSPLNSESSTFGAFFMSEMERLSTVKSITGLDLG